MPAVLQAIDQIVASGDIAGGALRVLACQFDPEVNVVNDVLLDHHPGAAVDIDAVGRFVVAVRRIALGSDVVDQISAYHPSRA